MDTSGIVQTVLLCLVNFFMTARIVTRWGLMKALNIDDILSIIALVRSNSKHHESLQLTLVKAIYITRAIVFYVLPHSISTMVDTKEIIVSLLKQHFLILELKQSSLQIGLRYYSTYRAPGLLSCPFR